MSEKDKQGFLKANGTLRTLLAVQAPVGGTVRSAKMTRRQKLLAAAKIFQ